MKNFEAFLKALLKNVFKEYSFDKEKAKKSFENVKISSKNKLSGGKNNGNQERCAKSLKR